MSEVAINPPSSEALGLLDDAACGLLQTSETGTLLRVNRRFCDWIGRSSEELVGRMRFQELLTMGGRIFYQTHWAPLLLIQGSVSEVKLELPHRDGTLIPMVVNAVRHESRDGVMVHEIAAFVMRDRDKYERELVLAKKRLEDSVSEATRLQADAKDRALFAEQMVGIVSHDLRDPLNVITMSAAVLLQDPLTPRQEHVVTCARRAADRAATLIADLLDFTKARLAGGLGISVRPIDLHATIAEVVEDLASAHPGATLKHVRLGEGACSGDDNRLAQLVGNLVSNAVAYGDNESPVIITSRIDPHTFSVAVHNRGAPIPEALHARLFQPMTRGTDADNVRRSVGLGLYIVREIAKAHNGSVAIESDAEHGTTLTATFERS